MSRKIINCPHCGKILSPDLWKEMPLRQETVKSPQCGCEKVWKDGMRQMPQGKLQRYMCRDCGYRFSKR